jgi:hypothetical protein
VRLAAAERRLDLHDRIAVALAREPTDHLARELR